MKTARNIAILNDFIDELSKSEQKYIEKEYQRYQPPTEREYKDIIGKLKDYWASPEEYKKEDIIDEIIGARFTLIDIVLASIKQNINV